MSTKINNNYMSLEIDGRVIATAEFRDHAAADGHGAWTVSCHPGRLFTRNQAITAMVLADHRVRRKQVLSGLTHEYYVAVLPHAVTEKQVTRPNRISEPHKVGPECAGAGWRSRSRPGL